MYVFGNTNNGLTKLFSYFENNNPEIITGKYLTDIQYTFLDDIFHAYKLNNRKQRLNPPQSNLTIEQHLANMKNNYHVWNCYKDLNELIQEVMSLSYKKI